MGAAIRLCSDVRKRLAALAPLDDNSLDVGNVALTIARLDHPAAQTRDYRNHLNQMTRSLRGADECSALEKAHLLAETVAHLYGYDLPELEDDESDLMDTIDTRRGCPETLGVLALEIMGRAGWDAEALNFGPRFLIRITDNDGGREILDPAGRWQSVQTQHLRSWIKAHSGLAAELSPIHTQALTNRGVLVRLQNGAKVRHLKSGHYAQALQAIETTLLFAPNALNLWREAGILHARLDHVHDAIAALEHFLARTADPSLRSRTQQILSDLRQRQSWQ